MFLEPPSLSLVRTKSELLKKTNFYTARSTLYRGEVISWVKGSVPVLFRNLHSSGERGEKGESANFKTKHTEPLTGELPSAL